MKLSELVKAIERLNLNDLEETEDFGVVIVETSEPRKPPKTTYKIVNFRKKLDVSSNINDCFNAYIYLTILSRPRPTMEAIIGAIQDNYNDLLVFGFIDDLVQENESVKVETLKPLATPTEKTENEPLSHDVVNNPNHYKRGDIECFDALKSSMTKEQLLGHLKATAISYLWRYDLKNGVEDVKKAKWYVDRMVKELENE